MDKTLSNLLSIKFSVSTGPPFELKQESLTSYGTECAVAGCKNHQGMPGVSLHRFSEDPCRKTSGLVIVAEQPAQLEVGHRCAARILIPETLVEWNGSFQIKMQLRQYWKSSH